MDTDQRVGTELQIRSWVQIRVLTYTEDMLTSGPVSPTPVSPIPILPTPVSPTLDIQ